MGAESIALPEGVQRVVTFLQGSAHAHNVVMLDAAARTAQQAAELLGVALGQIAKSVVFRRRPDDAAVLVVISGDRRVDEKKVAAMVCPGGERLARADAAFVKTTTGFSIGGVAPVAHASAVMVLLDSSLQRFETIWAAAGHPHALFAATPEDLAQLTGAPPVDVAVDAGNAAEASSDLQHAVNQITARAREAQACGDVVPSPCISVCRIDADSRLCQGCFRTLNEISAWGRTGNDGKRVLWSLIEKRVAAAQVCS